MLPFKFTLFIATIHPGYSTWPLLQS